MRIIAGSFLRKLPPLMSLQNTRLIMVSPAYEERSTHSPPSAGEEVEDAPTNRTSEQIQNDAHQRMAEFDRADVEGTDAGGEPLTSNALEGNTYGADNDVFTENGASRQPSLERPLQQIADMALAIERGRDAPLYERALLTVR